MASPVPPSIDELGDKPFSFYPPIVNVEHNHWTMIQSNWSEILVRNSKLGVEVWIPRAYIGELSKVDEPVMILGLKRELEFKGGSIWPHARRVLQMPANPVAKAPSGPPPKPPESPLSISSGAESGAGKLLIGGLLGFALIVLITAAVLHLRTAEKDVEYRGVAQAELGLSADSDYHAIVRKLGPPEKEHWKENAAERQYQFLDYPSKDLIIVLMGDERANVRYIGARNLSGRVVDTVKLPGGGDTAPILRSLTGF